MFDKTALAIAVIGALNWGAVGLFGVNLVTMLFGDSMISRVIFTLVGLSGLWCISLLFRREAAVSRSHI